METRKIWAGILKKLRESGESAVFAAVSNLPVVFTHESITLITTNKAVFDLLDKNQSVFGSELVRIKLKNKEKQDSSIEQKLINLFGDKLEIEE